MRIAFILTGKLGDVVQGIPTYLELCFRRPSAEVVWVTLPMYQQMISTVARTIGYGNPPFGSMPPGIEQEFDQVLRLTPQWRHEELEAANMRTFDAIPLWAGVSLGSRKIILPPLPGDVEFINRLNLPKRFIAFATGPNYSVHQMPQDSRVALAKKLQVEGWPLVTVGGADGFAIEQALNLHGRLSYNQTAELVRRANLYIGTDTGTTWLACAAWNTPKICFVDPICYKNYKYKIGIEGTAEGVIRDLFYTDPLGQQVDLALQLLR